MCTEKHGLIKNVYKLATPGFCSSESKRQSMEWNPNNSQADNLQEHERHITIDFFE